MNWPALLASVLLLSIQSTWAETSPPSEQEVAAAVTELRADPNLAAERTMRVLRWQDSDKPKRKNTGEWFGWVVELFAWIAETGRLLVWLAVGVLAALLVVVIVRLIRGISPRAIARRFEVPTHVRDLDIRPESLPDDVGAAALELWQRDEHRAALSLLYRGLLSRLAHVHELPIRHSTTEGDCIDLAAHHLQGERSTYVSRLVRMWQLAVYGGHEPATVDVQELCAGFAAALAKSHAPMGTAP